MADPKIASNGDKIVDEGTTVQMVKAFDTCQDACTTIQGLVDTAHNALMARWGGNAARSYDNSMVQWKEGFQTVRTALNTLNEAMISYSKITDSTEDDNVVQGSSWANGVPA
jgi:WXG100 family type VII secretion target